MTLVLYILSSLVLLCIAWQDFTTRRITVWLYPVFVLFLMLNEFTDDAAVNLVFTCINLSLVFIQLVILYYYLYVKYGKRPALFTAYFGWGDVLMLVCAAFVFEPRLFVFYTVGSAILSVVLAGCYQLYKGKKMAEIPFAGVASLALLVCYITGITNDENVSFNLLVSQ